MKEAIRESGLDDETTKALSDVATKAWRLLERFQDGSSKFGPMPIIYFGNLSRFLNKRNPERIITVGLNPSHLEFRNYETESYSVSLRFPAAEPVGDFRKISYLARYLQSLNEYFMPRNGREKAYWKWFRNFDHIFESISCSFIDVTQYLAIHTDLFSPLSTYPTYSEIRKKRELIEASELKVLTRSGVNIWLDLANLLRPDVVLMSANQPLLAELASQCKLTGGKSIFNGKNTSVELYETSFGGNDSLLFYGTNSIRGPFGNLTESEKAEFGHIIRRLAQL